ncbi:MAG: YncE family protein [Terriglobales bacterium]
MKQIARFASLAAAVALAAFLLPPPAQAHSARPAGYHLAKVIHLGGNSGWDYMAVDSARGHVFISHGTHVLVFSTRTERVVGDIPNTLGVHGIALAPRLDRGFISDGRAQQVTIFSLSTLRTLGTAHVGGHGPDCILYDPATQRAFTINGESDNSTAIDGRTGKVIGTFPLGQPGQWPEYATADGRGHIFDNLSSASTLLEIDARRLRVIHRWPLAPCQHPSGQAMDRAHHRLFIGCHNDMMAIVNADTGRVIQTIPIASGVDANRFDPGTQLAFSSNGAGSLTVVHEVTPNHFVLLGNVKTEPGARTMALDRLTHTVYEVTANLLPRHGHHWPGLVPGTFRLLILPR